MRRTVLLVLVMALIAPVTTTRAAEPPAEAIENVEFVANIPEPTQATAINFMRYGAGT